MNNRLKELRKTLNLSQKDFGAKLKLSPDMISLLERGKRKFTERVISDICREFDVNRSWLENGEGDMFIDILAEIDEFNNADKDVQEMVRLYMQLDDVTRAYFKKKMLDELKQ
ncbi:helix-turn-helix transcriptional regulator [Clostridium perfringens]|uniref:Putative prophage repressor n=1 Tax=Clostridium perfringens TaxID=1502 RepID=A0A2X2YB27_CLOPF|nr:helix-turn-helix transcriptional regulator [Clostridium perfringens]EDS81406.1 helix-turn-helix domain protein [Clostridium perfringens C str. JGS1495]MBI6069252.1 helix-turn-helix transcriptional regulator [Clostridium perfringens]MBI6096459.1 helix-turn-helix transcriptional regulator [Clostridium perfringens]MCF2685039.1 helix-turn-helix transcriptional regulator [Clostridium perfringens]MCI5750073.1 helix-turn-helix transcriptional regulator [Clostridium perfringens]